MTSVPPDMQFDLFTEGRGPSAEEASERPGEGNGPPAALESQRRHRFANAVTAVLLHAEVIQRYTRFTTSTNDEIEASLEAIKRSANAIWDLFEETGTEAVAP